MHPVLKKRVIYAIIAIRLFNLIINLMTKFRKFNLVHEYFKIISPIKIVLNLAFSQIIN